MNPRVDLPREEIAAFCRRWQVVELALFGSVLRNDLRPGSDVDVLVAFEPEAHRTLFDLVRMNSELAAILGREVDLVGKRGIEMSRNHLRREAILGSAEVVYGPSPRRPC